MAAPRFEHLTGVRFWLCLWITVFHIAGSPDPDPRLENSTAPLTHGDSLEPLPWWFYDLGRRLMDDCHVHMGVSAFVALSGFVTQRAYGAKPLRCGRPLIEWYVKRLDRVVFTAWVTMLVDLVVFMMVMTSSALRPENTVAIVASFFFVNGWLAPFQQDFMWGPNFPSWAMGAAFIPSWLVYPFITQRLLSGRRGIEIAGLLTISYISAVLPDLYTFATQVTVDDRTATILYVFPARWLLAFFFGAATSAALSSCEGLGQGAEGSSRNASAGGGLQRPKENTPLQPGVLSAPVSGVVGVAHMARCHAWGTVADLCVVAYVCVLCLTPGGSRDERVIVNGYAEIETFHDTYTLLYLHGTLPIVGLFLFASCASHHPGHFGTLCAHPACVALGTYAFEVYLLSVPIMHIVGFHSAKRHLPAIGLLVLIWLAAGVYAEFVQNPFTAWLRRKISRPAAEAKATEGEP